MSAVKENDAKLTDTSFSSDFHWKKPIQGMVKLNVDAAYFNNCGTAGIIIRNSEGSPLAIAGSHAFKTSPLHAEIWAITKGDYWSYSQGSR